MIATGAGLLMKGEYRSHDVQLHNIVANRINKHFLAIESVWYQPEGRPYGRHEEGAFR
jgi:hypothetical protein